MADIIRAKVEPITLRDLILYDAEGKSCRTYHAITFTGEALKDAAGKYITKTQDDWISHYVSGKERLPSLPLLYAIIERLHEEKNPAA